MRRPRPDRERAYRFLLLCINVSPLVITGPGRRSTRPGPSLGLRCARCGTTPRATTRFRAATPHRRGPAMRVDRCAHGCLPSSPPCAAVRGRAACCCVGFCAARQPDARPARARREPWRAVGGRVGCRPARVGLPSPPASCSIAVRSAATLFRQRFAGPAARSRKRKMSHSISIGPAAINRDAP